MNCLTAERRCPYLEAGGPDRLVTGQSGQSASGSTPSDASDDRVPPLLQLTLETSCQSLPYIELLHQWLSHTCHTCLAPRHRAGLFAATMMNTALRYPFLMHSVLALAALHRSFTHASSREFYLSKSRELQEEGLLGFNRLTFPLDDTLALPAFLFSYIAGIRHLCLHMAYPKTDLVGFISSMIECIDMLRGVPTVLGGRMDMLKHSEFSPVVDTLEGSDSATPSPQQQQVDRLGQMIQSSEMSGRSNRVLTDAIKTLRQLYRNASDIDDESLGLAVVWMMTTPAEFTQLLTERQPQAMVVLAYVAPLLHYRRNCWAIGNVAARLMWAIEDKIPPQWQQWLAWPKAVVSG